MMQMQLVEKALTTETTNFMHSYLLIKMAAVAEGSTVTMGVKALSEIAGICAATVTIHLAQMQEQGLLTVESVGVAKPKLITLKI